MPLSDHFSKNIGRIRHELLLVNNRVNWLIGSQTLFIGTYLIALEKSGTNDKLDAALETVPIVGAIFAIVIYIGILAAMIVIRRTVRQANDLELIAYPDTYSASLLSPILIPATFIGWWIYLSIGIGMAILAIISILVIVSILLYRTRLKVVD